MLTRLLAAFAALLFLAMAVNAGAWTRGERGYYLKLGGHALKSRHSFDASGAKVARPGMGRYTDRGLVAYLEYGLRDRFTLVASAPYSRLEDVRRFAIGTGTERNNGFGDFELRLRWRIRQRPLVVSVAAGGRMPMGYDVEADTRIPLGTAEMAADLRLLMGRSLYPFPGYATGEVGYRARRGPFGDELLFSLESGASAGHLLFKLNISGVRSVSTCGDAAVAGVVGDQDILNVSPGVIYRLGRSRELSVDFNHVAAGCNSSASSSVSLGIAFNR